MLSEAKLRRICARAYTGTALLQNLPKTCQWASVLRTSVKHLETAHRILGLEFCPGAVFTGPQGNGRHTHANALANNLVEKAGYRAVLGIHGIDLDFEDPDELYEVLDFVEKIAMGSGSAVLLLDQPELSDHGLRFQNQLLRLQQSLLADNKNLFLIVITGSAEDVADTLLARYPRYHCPKPDSKAVSAFVKKMLQDPVPIHIEKISQSTIANAAKDCSWKQLKDLHNQLLRLIVIKYQQDFQEYKAQGNTEKQVYQEGLIKLSAKDVQAILDAVAAQNPQPVLTSNVPASTPNPGPILESIPGHDTPDDGTITPQEVSLDPDDPIGAFVNLFGNIPVDVE